MGHMRVLCGEHMVLIWGICGTYVNIWCLYGAYAGPMWSMYGNIRGLYEAYVRHEGFFYLTTIGKCQLFDITCGS